MRDNFCIQSVSDCKQINQSVLNHSPTKHLWSFGKRKRFPDIKVYCDNIYELPGFVAPKKGTGFGYGKKYDFTKDLTSSPPATKYQLDSEFQSNKTHRQGYSISIGREMSQRNGHIELQPIDHPGIGQYNIVNNDRGSQYTMRQRTKVLNRVNSLQCQNQNPGPGKYENPETLTGDGKYYLAKYFDSKAPLFTKDKERFHSLKNQVPGPGAYIQNENSLSKKGRYVLSKNNGQGTRVFDKQTRRSFVDDYARIHENPGPGSYRSSSEFGMYDIKNSGKVKDK